MRPTVELRELLSKLMASPVTTLGELAELMAKNIADHWWSILILIVGFGMVQFVLRRATRSLSASLWAAMRVQGRRSRRIQAQNAMTTSVVHLLLWVVFWVMLAGQLGVVISPATFGILIGSVGLAVALVSQGYVKDAISGWAFLVQDTYGIGDYIDVGFGFSGTVVGMNLHTTRLRGVDGTIYHVRNSEMPRIANRTQQSGNLTVDLELTRFDDEFVTSADLDEWEQITVSALTELREVLKDVRTVADDANKDVDLERVAEVVPVLVPNLTADTLTDMRAIHAVENPRQLVQRSLAKAPAQVTPVLRDIEMLGLVGSSGSEATIRVRVLLADPRSKSYALSLMRRKLFDAFNPFKVSTSFSMVAEGEQLN